MFLHAEAKNSGAVRFYERMGFQAERIQLVKCEMQGDAGRKAQASDMASKMPGGG